MTVMASLHGSDVSRQRQTNVITHNLLLFQFQSQSRHVLTIVLKIYKEQDRQTDCYFKPMNNDAKCRNMWVHLTCRSISRAIIVHNCTQKQLKLM